VVLAVTLIPSGALAASGPAAPPSSAGRFTLVSQDAWTQLGGTFRAQVQIGVAEPGLELSVIAHQVLATRSTFEGSIGGDNLGPVLAQVLMPVANLGVAADGSRQVAIGLEAPSGAYDPSRLAVHRPGVYPLEVQLRDSQDQTLARFVTYLVAVDVGADGQPQAMANKLGVAWVWPIDGRPALSPNGSIDPTVNAALEPDGRLGRQVAALSTAPNVPVTLAPAADTLDAWNAAARADAGAAAGTTALRAAFTHDEVLAGSYVPIDLPSLLHANLGDAADAEYVQGGVSLDRFFGTHVDATTALALPADAESIGHLRARGVSQVVVDETAVGATGGRLTTVTPFSIEPSPSLAPTGPVAAVADDARLGSLLNGSDPPALRAQRFLAGLALTATEQPGLTRAVVVVNPNGFDPPTALLTAVLTGLSGHPWLAPMTVSDVFRTVARTGQDVRSLGPDTGSGPVVGTQVYKTAEDRLTAFGSLVSPDDPRVVRAERYLLSSISSAWAGPNAANLARGELFAMNAIVNDFLARIRIPAPGTITLTARSGAIPITFRNDTGQPIRVAITLSSHKLDFPGGQVRTVALPPRSTTVRFDVRSRTSGTFPLEMTIRSADGSLLIARGNFKVRSTVVSTVGVALAAGAALFLASWWMYDIRRRRRHRAASAT
jgi:hypothetical protein